MKFPRRLLSLVLLLGSWAGGTAAHSWSRPGELYATVASSLPAKLSDQEFWRLSTSLSEPDGSFLSENLVSNEHTFQYVVPTLAQTVKPGGVYLGVAPDQNFTYIAAVAPAMAFIVDIRRGNLLEHLLYKALIELSTDRADFLSRLFSKRRPAGLTASATVTDLFDKFDDAMTSEAYYAENLRAVREHLISHHGFPLTTDDLTQLESIYYAFFWEGPGLRYSARGGGPANLNGFGGLGVFRGSGGGGVIIRTNGTFPSYEELQMQSDLEGAKRSYLASEDNFRFIKRFEEKNLLVPVVGNFAGPKSIRAVGAYIREHGATVGAFYVSNVEQYLFQDGLFPDFARNVATLPVDDRSVFIRSVSNRFGFGGPAVWMDGRATALDPIRPFVQDFQANRIRSYVDVNTRSR